MESGFLRSVRYSESTSMRVFAAILAMTLPGYAIEVTNGPGSL